MSGGSPVRGRILVAGEVLEQRDFAIRLLDAGGFTVDIATDGAQAIDLLQRFSYDLILVAAGVEAKDRGEAATVRDAATRGRVEVVPAPLSTLRLLDLVEQTAALRRTDDPELAALAADYLAARARDIPVLRASLARRDFAAVSGLAHRIKGTGRSYGFAEVTELAAAIEAAAGRGDAPAVHALLDALETAVNRRVTPPPRPSPEEPS